MFPSPFHPPTAFGTGTIPSRYRHRSLVPVARGRDGVPCWCVFWVCVWGGGWTWYSSQMGVGSRDSHLDFWGLMSKQGHAGGCAVVCGCEHRHPEAARVVVPGAGQPGSRINQIHEQPDPFLGLAVTPKQPNCRRTPVSWLQLWLYWGTPVWGGTQPRRLGYGVVPLSWLNTTTDT